MITCTKCHESKHPDDFNGNRLKKNGKHSWCKLCIKMAKVKENVTLNKNEYLLRPIGNQGVPNADKFTLEQCEDAAFKVGLTDDDAFEFYHHFRSAGFIKANQNAIIALDSQMVMWKLKKDKMGKVEGVKKVKLFPNGKTCGKQKTDKSICRMPSVYTNQYGTHCCLEHCPEEIKEMYC